MNIPPLAPPAASPASLPALTGVNPGAAPTDVVTQPAIVVGASIVDLSKLGQLLSASNMPEPQPLLTASVDRVGEQDASATLDDGFGKLLAAAQVFVDTFNQFQSAEVSNLQDPLIAPFQNVLLLAINAELPASGTDTTLLASLAQVGIDFQDVSNPVGSAQLAINVTALQAAFNANPAGTSASLTQAFQALGQIAATFSGQAADLFISEADLTPPASPFDLLPITAPPTAANGESLPVQNFLANQAPIAANPAPVTNAPLQAALADQYDELAIDPAAATIAAPVNTQTAAASLALPVSQSDASAAVSLSSPASAVASQVTLTNAAAAALQSSLADQALRDAFDVNLPAVPAAVVEPAAPAAAAAAAAVPAEQADAAPIAATAQAGVGLSATNQLANATTIPATGISAAQLPTPLAALDDGRAPLALDPSVAAAVAAYRLGDGAVPTNKPAQARPEPRSDIRAVSESRSAALDPHDDSGDARRNEAARNAALALAENKALAATTFPPDTTVDRSR